MKVIQLDNYRPADQVGAVRLRCALNRLGEAIEMRERRAAALERIRERLEEMRPTED